MGIVTFSPKQDGTGDPSPTNVRPIHPGLVLKSKNLYNKDTADVQDLKIRNDSGTAVYDGANSFCNEMIPVKPNSEITISGFYDHGNRVAKRVYFLDENGNWISRTGGYFSPPITVTTPSNCHYIQLQLHRTEFESWENIQVELGSTPTEYEPYYDMEIYGGCVDFENGELVEEWVGTTKKLSEYTNKTVYEDIIGYYFNALFEDEVINNYLSQLCSIARYSWNMQSLKDNHFYIYYSSTANVKTRLMLYLLKDDSFDDNTEFTIAVKLKSPTTYPLTASQLTQAYNQLVPVSPVMINKRRRMLLNTPHLESVSGSVATFDTDMKADLKECKLYFSPVQ